AGGTPRGAPRARPPRPGADLVGRHGQPYGPDRPLHRRLRPRAGTRHRCVHAAGGGPVMSARRRNPGDTPPVLVVGAGPTGLSAAYHLGKRAHLLERESTVGGWCRSVECGGFTFDMAGHIMFSNDPYVHQMYA